MTCTATRGCKQKNSAQSPSLLCSWGILVTVVLPSRSSAGAARSHMARRASADEGLNLPPWWTGFPRQLPASGWKQEHCPCCHMISKATALVCTQQDHQVAVSVSLIITTFYSWHRTQRDEWGWYVKWHHPAVMDIILQRHSPKLTMCLHTHIHTSLPLVSVSLSCTSTAYL